MSEPPRSQRPPSVTCKTNTVKIQFRSPEIARAVGLEYVRVETRDVTETILCNAQITYDANRYAHLASRSSGVVREVGKDLGQSVTTGETLAIVDSAALGAAKAAYLQSLTFVNLWEKNYAREKKLLESNVSTRQETLEAETKLTEGRIALSNAFQQLQNFGLSKEQVQDVSEKRDTSSLLPLLAPFSGTVVERSAVIGEVVDARKPLLGVADMSLMWAMLDIYESDLLKVRNGQTIVFESEGLPGEQRAGRIICVSSHVDQRTRTLKVRAEIPNPDGLLRSGMFGKAIVSIRKNQAALVVPREAVQWEGCCNVVFVRRSDTLFEPRKVRIGYEMERHVVIESGVVEGEEVVTTGSFLLKTEILKGSIGAGCCEVDPGKK
jgi:cobalt-zinc-cadmium efflux system membrane fusion protein